MNKSPLENLVETLNNLREKSGQELDEIEEKYKTLSQKEDNRIRKITLSFSYDRDESKELGIDYNNVTERDTRLLRLALYLESRKAPLAF